MMDYDQEESLRNQLHILARDYGVDTEEWPTGAMDQLCQQFDRAAVHSAIPDLPMYRADVTIVPTIKETRRYQAPRFPRDFRNRIFGSFQEQNVLEDLELLQQRQYAGKPADVCIEISSLNTNVLEALLQTIDQYNERRLNSSRGGERWGLLNLFWNDLVELEDLLSILERPSIGELFYQVSLYWRNDANGFCNMGAFWPAIIRGRIEDFSLIVFPQYSQFSLGDEQQTLQALTEMISGNGGRFSQSYFRSFSGLAHHSLNFQNTYELRRDNVNLLLFLVKNCFPYLRDIDALQDIKDTARVIKEDDFLAQLEELEV